MVLDKIDTVTGAMHVDKTKQKKKENRIVDMVDETKGRHQLCGV